jgi:hypothetical protein
MELIDRDGTVIRQGGLTVTPHPLVLSGQKHLASDLIPGETLESFLSRHVDNIHSGAWAVCIDGHEVPQRLWSRTKPKHGTMIECRSVVRKEAIKLIAIVALAYFTVGFGAATTGMWGAGAVAGAYGGLVAGVVYVAGSLIINKVLGPKMADPGSMRDQEASPTYKIGGGRNRVRPYEPIGLLFGEMRITPDYAGLPYTWFMSSEQYMHSVFHAGINCASISGIRIGQTPLESYSDYVTRTAGFSGMPSETLEVWTNVDTIAGAQLTGYATLDTIVGAPNLPVAGNWVTRTSSIDTILLQADFEGSAYYVQDNGLLMGDYGFFMSGECRRLPSGDWEPFFEGVDLSAGPSTVTIHSSSTKPLRLTYYRIVPQGQYEVRFRKDTADVSGTRESCIFTWSTLKSIQTDTGAYGGMGRFGLRIKASGQLNGTLDELNWLATATSMPYWNGSGWTTATTRENGLSNPGAQMLLVARGIYDPNGKLIAGLGLSDSQIDIESFKGFMVRCAAKGFTFDHYFDSAISCDELLDAIAAVGLGSKTWQSGKLGVVWAAEDQPIEGVVNMATMKAKTFRVNYQTVETADGLEYTYFDRDRNFSWKTLRVSDPGVATPLNPARLTSIGVTSEAHAAILARFHLAQSIYQRKDISFETDLEHLTYKRMSVMALSHDVTQWGYGGRVQAAVNNSGILTLTLDCDVPAGGGPRYIGLRVPGELGYRVFGVAAFSGTSRTVTLTTAWPAGVAVPGSSAGNLAHDTLWMYDFKSTPGYKVRVVGIQPQAGMKGATVSVVPESAEFWNYVLTGAYTPPPSQSLLGGLPAVTRIEITEELQRQGNTFYVELTATFAVSGAYSRAQVVGATSGNRMEKLGDTDNLRFTWRGKVDDVWTIEVRPSDGLGRAGSAVSTSYEVRGLRIAPPDVGGFLITNGALSWPAIIGVPDLAGYRIRFHYGRNFSWANAAPLHKGLITESPWRPELIPPGEVTLMIKAFDTSENESVNTANITLNFGDPLVENLILEYDDKAAGFPGTKTDCSVAAGNLVADDSGGLFWGDDDALFWGDDSDPFWPTASYKEATYATSYTVTGEEAGSRMTLLTAVSAASYTLEYRYDTQGLFWGNDADYFWGDDADPFWPDPTEWQTWPGEIEDIQAGAIELRITMQAGATQGVISAFTLQFDVEDEREILNDVVISASGTRLPLTKSYRSIKIVNWTLQDNGGAAVRINVADKLATGPLMYGRDAAEANVSALADFEIIGVKQ